MKRKRREPTKFELAAAVETTAVPCSACGRDLEGIPAAGRHEVQAGGARCACGEVWHVLVPKLGGRPLEFELRPIRPRSAP